MRTTIRTALPARREVSPSKVVFRAGPDPLLAVRTCGLPASLELELLEAGNATVHTTYQHDARLGALLYACSPALHDAVGRNEAGNRDVTNAVRSYLLRSATRPTPLGFAGAFSLVEPGDGDVSACDELLYRVRPDAAWLSDVKQKLEVEPAVWGGLVVIRNSTARRCGRYILLKNHREHEAGAFDARVADFATSSFRATDSALFLLSWCDRERSIDAIVDALASKFAVDRDRALNLVRRLWTAGFFVSELDVNLLGDPWQSMLTVAARSASVSTLCADVIGIGRSLPAELLALDDHTQELFASVAAQMRRIMAASHYLQIDATRRVRGNIGAGVIARAECLADLLLRQGKTARLTGYKERFRNRYDGRDEPVPILELLDPDIGIGTPAGMELDSSPPECSSHLLMLYSRALRERKTEIVLCAYDVATIFPHVPANALDSHIEVAFQIVAANESDDPEIWSSGLVGGCGPAPTQGRFSALLSSEDRDRTVAHRRNARTGSAVSADLSIGLLHPRSANVVCRAPSYEYAIVFGHLAPAGVTALDISGLSVGIDTAEDRFYLWSEEIGCRVALKSTHVLNPGAESPLARLLHDIQFDGRRQLTSFNWGPGLALAPFLPRVRFEKVVLARAVWRLFRRDVEQDAAFDVALERWREHYDVPELVTLTHGDQKIPLRLETAYGRALVEAVFADPKSRYVEFEEHVPASAVAIPSAKGAYAAEYVLGLIREETDPVRADAVVTGTRAPESVFPRLVNHMPGGDWLYFKCFGRRQDLERLLSSSLTELFAEISDRPDTIWFFLWYADPRLQLRLRLRLPSSFSSKQRFDVITRIERESSIGGADGLVLDTYVPEYSRYGADSATMEYVERLFMADSAISAHVLRSNPVAGRSRFVDAIASADVLLRKLLGDGDPRAMLPLDREGLKGMSRDIARLVRERLVLERKFPLSEEYAAVDSAAQIYRDTVLDRLSDRRRRDVIGSLLHMHFNRCAIKAGEEERTARLIYVSALSSLWLSRDKTVPLQPTISVQ